MNSYFTAYFKICRLSLTQGFGAGVVFEVRTFSRGTGAEC